MAKIVDFSKETFGIDFEDCEAIVDQIEKLCTEKHPTYGDIFKVMASINTFTFHRINLSSEDAVKVFDGMRDLYVDWKKLEGKDGDSEAE